eukprot:m.39568 g.39568  ORF g.39568 m.39568 type:complete len:636 (+) comp9569_c0_seq1:156-2063(+)
MSNLRKLAQDQILENVIKSVKPENGWKVLIVDKSAVKIIDSCCRMHDLMEEGVAIVEVLELNRKPMKTYEAVYFMAPTEANIELLKKDFVPRPKYKAAHVVFIDSASDSLLQSMAHPNVKACVKSVRELTLSFVAQEARVYTLKDPQGLYNFYSSYSRGNQQNELAAHLANVCATLGESPVIRYEKTSADMAALATVIQERVDEHRKYSPEMQASFSKKKSQLILLDRGFDLVSPLVREFTYQAAAYDLCQITDDVYKYIFEDGAGKRREKKVILGENDELWDECRHEHVSQVFQTVSTKFKEFEAKYNADHKETGNKTKTQQLKEMMQAAPEKQHFTNMYSLHLDLSNKILKSFTSIVEKCTASEQDMVMGEDAQQTRIKDFIPCISDIIVEKTVSVDNKIRALLLCIIASNGLKKEELSRLLDLGEIPVDRRPAIYNLNLLGATVEVQKKSKPKKSTRRAREQPYDLSRWTPLLKDIVEDAISGKLSLVDYPSFRDQPVVDQSSSGGDEAVTSARRGGWAKGRKDKDKGYGGGKDSDAGSDGRIIVFIAGCISYSEMRVAYEISKEKGWDVFVGSHNIATPNVFLQALTKLHENQSVSSPDPFLPGAGGAGDEGTLTFTKGSALQGGGAVHSM